MTAAWLAGAFLAGSLPTAWLWVRLRTGQDIRTLYSGNPGASNVRRVSGWGAFAVVLAIDAGKGALPVALALWLGFSPANAGWIGCAAIAGHCWTPWLGWNGGKGVATAGGVFLVLAPWSTLAGFAVWLLLARGLGRSSLASLGALVTVAIGVIGWHSTVVWGPFGLAAALILWRHRENWQRLREGREWTLDAGPPEQGGNP